MSQSKVSFAIVTVANIMSKKLLNKYVKFPQTAEELYLAKVGFLQKYNFHGLIGIIDGTHVQLTGLSHTEEIAHVNRKGTHSKNVQIICSSKMEIINVFARYPGSAHDAIIWQSSRAHGFLEELNGNGERSTWLLGDSAYPLQPWLMTPFSSPSTLAEREFNKIHSKVRSLVERCIVYWCIRFRCILGEKKLRYKPGIVGAIINACVILHNILIAHNFPITPEEEDEIRQSEFLVDLIVEESEDTTPIGVAVEIRNRIMEEIVHL